MEKLLFTADLHGNMTQYRLVLEHAVRVNADAVIFGGDLTPKDLERRTPALQRAFLQNELFPLLDEYKERGDQNKRSPHLLFIMGNDDFKSNYDVMVDGQDFHGYRMIDQIPYVTTDGHAIIGYSYVPYNPFIYHDFVRRDLDDHTDITRRPDTCLVGVVSQGDELVPHIIDPKNDQPTIEQDMRGIITALAQNAYDPKRVILVSHAPPYDTVCDHNRENKHVGSIAVRNFVEIEQPLLVLSGHIHEAVDQTNKMHGTPLKDAFKQQIGHTTCAAVGNDHKYDDVYILEIDLNGDTTPQIQRIKLGLAE